MGSNKRERMGVRTQHTPHREGARRPGAAAGTLRARQCGAKWLSVSLVVASLALGGGEVTPSSARPAHAAHRERSSGPATDYFLRSMLTPDMKQVLGIEIDRQHALEKTAQPPFFKGGFKEDDAPRLRGTNRDEGPQEAAFASQAYAPCNSIQPAVCSEPPAGAGDGEGTGGLEASSWEVNLPGLYAEDMREDVQEQSAQRGHAATGVPATTSVLAALQQQAELRRFAAVSEGEMRPLDMSAVAEHPAMQPIRWLANATVVPLQKRLSDALLDAFDTLATQPEILVWNLQAGDHLRVKGVAGFMAMTHHAIYLGDGRIMHFTGGVTDKVYYFEPNHFD